MNLSNWKYRLCLYIAPCLLVAVVVIHLYYVHFYDLSPWKGGGFGMFSTVDRSKTRFIRCYLIGEKHDYPVEIPLSLRNLSMKVSSLPTEERISQLAIALNEVQFKERWLYPAGVRVEVWRFRFDSSSQKLKARKFREVTVK